MRNDADHYPPRFEREPDIEAADIRDLPKRLRVGTVLKIGERFIERVDARKFHRRFALYTEQPSIFKGEPV